MIKMMFGECDLISWLLIAVLRLALKRSSGTCWLLRGSLLASLAPNQIVCFAGRCKKMDL